METTQTKKRTVVSKQVKECQHLIKSNLSDEHLKDEHPKSPPIDSTSVGILGEYFWSQKFRCATKSARSIAKSDAFFAKPKISYANVALLIEQ